jgi:hypothetical protein
VGITNCTKPPLGIKSGIRVDNRGYSKFKYLVLIYIITGIKKSNYFLNCYIIAVLNFLWKKTLNLKKLLGFCWFFEVFEIYRTDGSWNHIFWAFKYPTPHWFGLVCAAGSLSGCK